MSSPNWQKQAHSALEATCEGPDRLHRAWVTARRNCMAACEGEASALWARGAYAVDPGPDPFNGTESVLTTGLCAMIGALGAGALAGSLFKPAEAPVFGAALGAFLGSRVWSHYRRLWPLFSLVCGFSVARLIVNGSSFLLPLALVLALCGWLAPRRLRGKGVFDMSRARWALEVALKAEGAMILAQLAKGDDSCRFFSDLQPALADLAAARGDDRLLAAEALLQQAQAAGLVAERGNKTFIWNEGSQVRYQAFGAAFEGDLMIEERPPWRDCDGRLVKGLARRVER